MQMEPVRYLHGIRQDFLYCSCISTGTVMCYSFYMFILRQPFLQSTVISSVKYSNRCMCCFINNNGSVGMPFLKAKSSTPMELPHFISSCNLKRFVSRRITLSPLILRFMVRQICGQSSQLVSIANIQIKSVQRSVIRL